MRPDSLVSGSNLSTGWTTIPVRLPSVYQKAGSAMSEDTPVLDTLSEITAVSAAHGTLEAREHMLARLAALVAVDAPPVSYLAKLVRPTMSG